MLATTEEVIEALISCLNGYNSTDLEIVRDYDKTMRKAGAYYCQMVSPQKYCKLDLGFSVAGFSSKLVITPAK